ncbi:hypothetical protein B0H14DRAFT_2659073 [Mycena olivaceomarginata]|nr:hypothetical protein B0H14DRAFT_2659073 [Mycena olivaceomarginata]
MQPSKGAGSRWQHEMRVGGGGGRRRWLQVTQQRPIVFVKEHVHREGSGGGEREARGRRWEARGEEGGAGGEQLKAAHEAVPRRDDGICKATSKRRERRRWRRAEMDGIRRARCHIEAKHPNIEAPHQLLFWQSKYTRRRRPEAKERAKYGKARTQNSQRWSQLSAYDPQSFVHRRGAHRTVVQAVSWRRSEEAKEGPNEGPEWPEASGNQFAQNARTGERV